MLKVQIQCSHTKEVTRFGGQGTVSQSSSQAISQWRLGSRVVAPVKGALRKAKW